MTDAARPTLGIAVLTLNEARRIDDCLRSAAFADQVVVIDSGSTDDTRERAAQLGAEVHLHADWQGFAVQRTRALAHLRTDWVFYLDADEEITPSLRDEILRAIASREPGVWRIWWDEVAFGRALTRMKPRGGILRLFPRDALERFDGVVHEAPVLRRALPDRDLKNRLLHHSRPTVYGSLRKLAQYVQLGAVKRSARGKRGGVLTGLVMGLVVFLRVYLFQRGFLCGGPGFLYSLFIALETFFRHAALRYDAPDPGAGLARR
ncbi:MAG: glycosyltransferase family 2 protein [Hydrogenophaga sp.]|jgi:glycosyltransferase involved in cell wall biosynthesis|nr:glycosyltransferase family 2 protein [Hydrogenophaga sp.]